MNVLICDDDKYTRKMIEAITSKNPIIDKVFISQNGVEAINIAKNKSIDIALLDISMPVLNGIDTAKALKKISSNMLIVFITAYKEYAFDAICVHPYDYILKPVDPEEFYKKLNTFVRFKLSEQSKKTNKHDNFFIIKKKRETFFLYYRDILFLEALNGSIVIHTYENEYSTNKTLSQLESFLDTTFIKTHRSYMVNRDKIYKIKDIRNRSYEIEFKNYNKVALMSRYKYEELKEKIIPFIL